MTDHPKIPLAGVIGHPIAHTRSPALHGHWLKTYGIKGHYVPMDVAPADLASVLRALPKAGFVGCNVTIPHKEQVLHLADEVSDRARQIGAANTLTFRPDGTIHADNTDGYGFLANLTEAAPGWSASTGPAAVIGAGGAARAIIVALLSSGCPEIRLANRTRARAEVLAAEFGPRVTVRDWSEAGDMMEGTATLVNTSSLGMPDTPEFTLPLDALPASAVVTDLVYTPLQTRLLIEAAKRGCATVDGFGMLLHQAVPGFEAWFGHRPEVTPALRETVLSA